MDKVIHIDSRGRIYRKLSREEQAKNERIAVLTRRMLAEGHKRDVMVMPYGGKPISEDGKLLQATRKATIQKSRIKHTTKGDFTHLHSGHNELR